jgi:hypothetical protein
MPLPLIPIAIGLGLAAYAMTSKSTSPSAGGLTSSGSGPTQVYQNHLYQLTLRGPNTNPSGGPSLASRLQQLGWTDIVIAPMKGQDPYVFYIFARWPSAATLLFDQSDIKYLSLADQTPHVQYDAGMPENIRLSVQTALESETDPARLRSFSGSLLPNYPASAEALRNKALILESLSGIAPPAPPVPPPPYAPSPPTGPLPANTLPPMPPVYYPPATPIPIPTVSNPVGGIDLTNLIAAGNQIATTLGLPINPATGLPYLPGQVPGGPGTTPPTPAAPPAPSAPPAPPAAAYKGMAGTAGGPMVPSAAGSKTTAHAAGQTDLVRFFGSHKIGDPEAFGKMFSYGASQADGVIGPITRKATWLFQHWWNTSRVPSTGEAGLTEDGLFGAATYAALKKV